MVKRENVINLDTFKQFDFIRVIDFIYNKI